MKSKIKIQVRPIIHTKEGRVFKTYPWKNANSLIKAFVQILMVQMSQANQDIYNITPALRSVFPNLSCFSAVAAATVTNNGIVIGSGITAVVMTDYKLETQIITGVAHGAQAFTLENPNASTWRINLSRIFTNNTGGVLAIKEVGLYVLAESTAQHFCAERTLYAVDVPDTYPITFQYRITITL